MPETTKDHAPSKLLPLAAIAESKTNPRQSFDKEKMAELSESVRTHGVLEPILVRPLNGGSKHEIVFGARRYRAACDAGLASIPAMVRQLDDIEALELQLVENSKREDVPPLEEADGYRRLHEQHKRSVEQIAKRVNRSPSYIYGRMKLCQLGPAGRKALGEGKIEIEVAILLARIPSAELQEKAAKDLTRFDRIDYRWAQEILQRDYMLLLSQASFDPKDAKLLPAAGACSDCPKSTANQRELFADVGKAVLCTDPGCHKQKTDLAWQARAAAAEKTGEKVLDKDPAKLFPYGRLAHNSGYTDLAEPNYQDPKHRTYGQLLKGGAVEVVIARDPAGQIHRLVKTEQARKLIKGLAPESRKRGEDPERKAKRDFEINKAIAERAVGAIIQRAQAASGWKPAQWLLLLDLLHVFDNADRAPMIVKRRGLKEDRKQAGKTLEAAAAKMAPGELASLLLEWSITGMASKWGGLAPQLGHAAKAFGIDMKAIRAAVAKDRAAAPAKAGK